MSGKKIGSLTNNSRGGRGSRMQTRKVLNQAPHLLLPGEAWAWGRRAEFTEEGGKRMWLVLGSWQAGRWPWAV